MSRIQVFDTTLRDGEQSPGATMTLPEKLRVAHQLDALGVDIIEAGFPITSPDDFRAVKQIATEVRRPVIAGLARADARDIERAAAALEGAERGRLHVFLATSDIHLQHKLRLTRPQCLERAVAAVELARRHTADVEFSLEDATRTDLDFMCQVVQAVVDAGATTVNLPDTVGYAHPAEMRRMIERVTASVRGLEGVVLSVHCHNDLGLAVANSLAAVEAGARQVECTINGIGERAGNAALEEIVMALRVRADSFPFETGVNTPELHRTSQLVTYFTGIQPQPNKAIVGRNAFAHEAGIHQDGMLKNRATYEIMTPEMVGVPESQLVLGKHSGRNALSRRFRDLGYELTADGLERAYNLFKLLAEKKKRIEDEDLIAILHHGTMEDARHVYRLRHLEVTCGQARSTASLTLERGDDGEVSATGEGDGPIAAAFAAVDALHSHKAEVEDLKIEAATPGRDAVGEVVVRVKVDGKTFTGRGASTDVVNAAVRAYLHTLDKAEQARELEAKALEEASYLWGV